jgi:hypothetical protein
MISPLLGWMLAGPFIVCARGSLWYRCKDVYFPRCSQQMTNTFSPSLLRCIHSPQHFCVLAASYVCVCSATMCHKNNNTLMHMSQKSSSAFGWMGAVLEREAFCCTMCAAYKLEDTAACDFPIATNDVKQIMRADFKSTLDWSNTSYSCFFCALPMPLSHMAQGSSSDYVIVD